MPKIFKRVWQSCLCVALAASAAAQTSPPVSFDTPQIHDAGLAVATADLNGDGRPDLVTVGGGYAGGSLLVFLGQGSGAFAPPVQYTVGHCCDFRHSYMDGLPGALNGALIIADFNHDGKLDVAAAGDDGAGVLLGNGDGTFQAAHHAYAGGGVSYMVAGDFNGDGNLDLVFAHYNSGVISIALGKGDGTFHQSILYPAGHGPYSLGVADFNGDGKLDLVVARADRTSTYGGMSLLLGTGTGGFQAPVNFALGSYAGMVVGDFNGDGKPDVAALRSITQTVADVMLGNGDGTFQPALRTPVQGKPVSLIAGDFNGDGKIDLALDTGTILLGNGDGNFHHASRHFNVTGFSLAAADFNGDGKQDLAMILAPVNCISGCISLPFVIGILPGNGDGTFAPAPTPVGLPKAPYATAVGDFNADGNQDVAVADGSEVRVLLGNGRGQLQKAVNYSGGYGPYGIAVGDFNHDGKLDLVVTNNGHDLPKPGHTVSVLLGKGDGSFRKPVSYTTPDYPFFVHVADLNGDGKPDLIVVGTALSILLGKGDGTFQPAVNYLSGAASTVAIGDFNGDNIPDLAVGGCPQGSSATVSMLLGKGDGTFQVPVSYTAPACPSGLIGADLRGNGKLDLVVGGYPSGFVFLGNGDGTLAAPSALNYPFVAPLLADLNGDGKLDAAFLMTQSYAPGGAFAVALGNGDGTFQPPVNFCGPAPACAPLNTLSLADFNNDGKPDVLGSFSGGSQPFPSGGNLVILKNTTP